VTFRHPRTFGEINTE